MQDIEHTLAGFRHSIVVRYGECDMQGVVFNPNYLVYADDLCDQWLIASLGREWSEQFDCALMKAAVEWHAAARHGDRIDFSLVVTRWGNSSFDVRMRGAVDGLAVVTIDLTYFSVAAGAHTPVPVPGHIREPLMAVAG